MWNVGAPFSLLFHSLILINRPSLLHTSSYKVFAISGVLVLGTILCVQLLSGMEYVLPGGWFAAWRDYTWPVGLGFIFTAAGVSHFTMTNAFCNIVPYRGCWGGLWQVPALDFLGFTYEEFFNPTTSHLLSTSASSTSTNSENDESNPYYNIIQTCSNH